MATGAQMWQSEMFTVKIKWLCRKTSLQQLKRGPTFSSTLLKNCSKGSNIHQQLTINLDSGRLYCSCRETAAAKEGGETQAILFAMLQEQHNNQMETMAATNKSNMDAMMENALVASSSGRRHNGKENTPPTGNTTPASGGTDATKKPKCKKKLCPDCKMFVFPNPDTWYELEVKEATQYPGWKSVHAPE
jgi:hypothetical protein